MKKSLSLLLLTCLLGLSVPSQAVTTGKIYFTGNIAMPSGFFLKVYVTGSVREERVTGSIALLGPDGRVICYPNGGHIQKTTAYLVAPLLFDVKDSGGNVFRLHAEMRVEMTKSRSLQTLGWAVMARPPERDKPEHPDFPDGALLWTSGIDASEKIIQLPVRGLCFFLVR